MRCAILFHSLVIVICFETSLEDGPVNYCGARMCAYSNGHTFCRYPAGPSPVCEGYIDARLSQDDKLRVLRRLNRRRSEVARGGRGLPAAADMLKLRWVEELAREAQRWADQCQPPSTVELHDDCRDLYSITVGQCVSSVVGEAPGLRFETMVDMWPMQGRLYKRYYANRTETTAHKSTGYYGDYAQMFWSRTYMVGCGRSRFMVPWHGRKRSVDRLVCNFAPRWPGPRRELWSPGDPTSACPARSRPDDESPELCSYHYSLDELYDEDNTMSLEEHLLLDTVLEIERNASLDYIGRLDELYLTKLAIATMQNPILTSPKNAVISVQKRSILKEIQSDTDFINRSYVRENASTGSNLKYKILKRKSFLLGRPKTYNIDDLNESNIKKENDDKDTIKVERDIRYEDYDFVGTDEGTSDVTTYQPSNKFKELLSSTENILREGEEVYVTELFTETLPSNMYHGNTIFETFLNDTNTDLAILHIYPNIVDEYLSDPETAQQLQEVLHRMERNLAEAASYTTSGKVRRELRDLKRESLHNLKNESVPDGLSERDLNDTDRGPMLNMVLKYMPYLKPFEKSIIGDTKANVNSARVVSPSFILFVVIYF